jgi:4-methyl-5(b-hydroxyethyl)-thiazole monophosphate biosynthesis
LLRGVKATCYPGCEDEQWGAIITDKAAVTDGQFITGHGPGAALDFGYAIVDYLLGPEACEKVKAGMVWPY